MSTYMPIITNGVVAFYELPTAGAPINLGTGAVCVCSQVTSGALVASEQTTEVAATFCSPATTLSVASSFALELSGIQDWGRDDGEQSLSEFLFTHDGGQVIVALAPVNGGPVKAVAKVSVVAGDFLGAAGETLTYDATMGAVGYPDIYDKSGAVLRHGANGTTDPNFPVTGTINCGAVKGAAKPGDVFPAEPTITASDSTNAAKLAGLGYVASPTTAWTTGQKITIGTFDFNWSGTAWAPGAHA